MKRRMRWVICCAAAALFAAGTLALLVDAGVIRFNHPSRAEYPVRGVDVSEYQGAIDWQVLSGEGLSFAYIKATEGSAFVDPRFKENWSGARAAGLRVGAYHFFSFDSPGITQADNFLAQLGAGETDLPPAVDLELYGTYKNNPMSADDVWAELGVLIERIEAACGARPVLYVTQRAYRLYVEGRDVGCDIWIRDVFLSPRVEGWTFWQYTDVATLAGYSGREEHIDMNVFRGTEAEFRDYP